MRQSRDPSVLEKPRSETLLSWQRGRDGARVATSRHVTCLPLRDEWKALSSSSPVQTGSVAACLRMRADGIRFVLVGLVDWVCGVW